MIRFKMKNEKVTLDLIQFTKAILTIGIVVMFALILIDILRFPDCYLNTWRYQLKNEIEAGNEQSIEYYQRHYVDKGRILFE